MFQPYKEFTLYTSHSIYKSLYIQVVHCKNRHHWIVIKGHGSESTVQVFDLFFSSIDEETQKLCIELFGSERTIEMGACTKKEGSTDCGVHAIAVGAAIACGKSLEGDAKPCTSFAVLKICHSQINHNKIYHIIATFNCIDSDFRTSCNYPVCTSSLYSHPL